MMIGNRSACILLVFSIFTVGLGDSSWMYSNPFEALFHPPPVPSAPSAPPALPAVPPPPAPPAFPPPPPPFAVPLPPAPPAVPLPHASESNAVIEEQMRKVIQDELQKFQSSQTASQPSAPAAAPSNPIPAESTADMIRKIIADELSKALAAATTLAPEINTAPPPPVWKSWANTKYWAKKPGPDGQAPPGFFGALQYRYGPPDANVDAAHPAGSPGWVWTQIASKWAKDPTAVPPTQVVEKGDWQVVLPPQALPKE